MKHVMPWSRKKEAEAIEEKRDRRLDRNWFRSPWVSDPDFGFLREWAPEIDVSEDEKHIVVRAELPGLDLADVDVQLEGQTLTIRGEKKLEREEKEASYHVVERRYGSFARVLDLPAEVDPDGVTADYKQGVLKIRLPKREPMGAKQIPVKSA